VANRDLKPRLIGEALQLGLPKADAVAVRAAAVGGDLKAVSLGVALAPELLPPGADACDRELGGLGSSRQP